MEPCIYLELHQYFIEWHKPKTDPICMHAILVGPLIFLNWLILLLIIKTGWVVCFPGLEVAVEVGVGYWV